MRLLPSILLAIPSLALAAPPSEQAIWEYPVQQGETLWSIGRQHLESLAFVPRLQKLNAVKDAYHLPPGQKLRIPYDWTRHQQSSAQLDDMAGQVSAQNEKKQPLPLAIGQSYPRGTRFATGSDSMLRLRFKDGSTLLLEANSHAALGEQEYYPSTGAIQSHIQLDSGSSSSSVIPNLKMPSRYQIDTPSAITTVRGTEFRVSSDGRTATEVLQGKVQMQDTKHEALVAAGFGSVFGKERDGVVESLPPAPNLDALPARSEFNPAPLTWQAQSGENGYRITVESADAPPRRLKEQSTNLAYYAPKLPGNGVYTLRIRARNANGLSGYDSQRQLNLIATPNPPLFISAAGAATQRGRQFTLQSDASAQAPVRLQLSREADFQHPAWDRDIAAPQWQEPLPDAGVWYWRVARRDAQGHSGPFGDAQRLQVNGWLSAPAAEPRLAVIGRRYPIEQARYTLELRSLEDGRRYQASADQPQWLLSELPRGRFLAHMSVDGAQGYHASEAEQTLALP